MAQLLQSLLWLIGIVSYNVVMLLQLSYSNARQGASEQRSKPYWQYGERAAQFVTTPGVESGGGVFGPVEKQAAAVRRLYAF